MSTRVIVFHWREYLIEGFALTTFMISACVFGTLLWHPGSPAHAHVPDGLARRALMGAAMGATLIALAYSPWGKRSGAHMNPAFTLTFLRLGRIAPHDAAWYVAAQFAGGVIGVVIARALTGGALGHPAVHYVSTVPGMLGRALAFAAEVAISGILMLTVLTVSSSHRWKRYTGVLAALLVAFYIAFESPISGMSMNPARTLGSAVVAHEWTALWIYFTAPLLGMLAAGEWVRHRKGVASLPCGKIVHALPCLFCDHVRERAEEVGTIPGAAAFSPSFTNSTPRL
ncbi:MAG: aquaporin [Gemmatimonadota bacterium]|nr:aquaporin [Gemmatimonadota bacterium]